jgi:hypothetical protein
MQDAMGYIFEIKTFFGLRADEDFYFLSFILIPHITAPSIPFDIFE